MKKLVALCLMIVVLVISVLTSCSINNYKPICIKHQNSDYVAYGDAFLANLLNNSKWHNDVAKCECDYTIRMENEREIFYHSECGTFIDYDFNKSLTISEEDRVKLNTCFVDSICRSEVHFFDENQKCTACGYEYAECDHQWDDGVEIEGGLGGYVMEYTCTLCGDKKRETITIIPPSGVSHSISYQSDRTKELLMEGFAPTEAKPGDSVVLRTHPIMDADLAFYANGVKLTQTHADSDYWEYVFIMPDEDVVITHEITDGFLPD